MRITTLHRDQSAQVAKRLEPVPIAAPTHPCPTLSPLPVATRLTALVLAVLTTGLVVGSQFGLTAMYAIQAESVLAKAQPAQPTSQLVAKAN